MGFPWVHTPKRSVHDNGEESKVMIIVQNFKLKLNKHAGVPTWMSNILYKYT